MHGIVVWLSARRHSALVVTDGGANLAFGSYSLKQAGKLEVGDLVFAPGLRPDHREFNAGLKLVIAGFWPEVAHRINTHSVRATCHLLNRSGMITAGFATVIADSQSTKPLSIKGMKITRATP